MIYHCPMFSLQTQLSDQHYICFLCTPFPMAIDDSVFTWVTWPRNCGGISKGVASELIIELIRVIVSHGSPSNLRAKIYIFYKAADLFSGLWIAAVLRLLIVLLSWERNFIAELFGEVIACNKSKALKYAQLKDGVTWILRQRKDSFGT